MRAIALLTYIMAFVAGITLALPAPRKAWPPDTRDNHGTPPDTRDTSGSNPPDIRDLVDTALLPRAEEGTRVTVRSTDGTRVTVRDDREA
ncbi:hypothetical protein AN958_08279 [Leucoagaricus sp. SymC.cos]|nr:hypothetical protein AN958_08279 [Leucoagaricus sp. SymC.cos]